MGLHFVQGEKRLYTVGQLSFAARKLLCNAGEVRKASEDLLERAFQLLLVSKGGGGGCYDAGGWALKRLQYGAAERQRVTAEGQSLLEPSCT